MGDCSGQCVTETIQGSLGDGICDDGSSDAMINVDSAPINFACEEYTNDMNDCIVSNLIADISNLLSFTVFKPAGTTSAQNFLTKTADAVSSNDVSDYQKESVSVLVANIIASAQEVNAAFDVDMLKDFL